MSQLRYDGYGNLILAPKPDFSLEWMYGFERKKKQSTKLMESTWQVRCFLRERR